MLGYEELKTRFTYHPPSGSQPDRYTDIREGGLVLAALIDESCPDSREKSLALTSVDQAVMWANAAIARREDSP